MKYVDENLSSGEVVEYRAHTTWFNYAAAIIVWGAVALVTAGAGLLIMLLSILYFRSIEIAVTNQRLIYKRGIFSQKIREINRPKIEGVNVNRSVFGRMFGYGTVSVHGTGAGNITIRGVDDPLRFRAAIQR